MNNRKKIRVLIVDDSKYMRYVIAKILREDPDIEIAGEARDGIDGYEKILSLNPDVVTLDVEMPRMDGLETLEKVMATCPVPILMVSRYTATGGGTTIRALEAGAVDFVQKPQGKDSLTMNKVRDELISKIKVAATIDMKAVSTAIKKPPAIQAQEENPALDRELKKVVVIGSSTGGPRALTEVVSNLAADLPVGILIVQHMPPGFTTSLASRLDEVSGFEVKEGKTGDIVEAGKALVAPGDYHMRIRDGGTIYLSSEDPENSVRPAIDVTIRDAASVFGEKVICVILTGMGKDGTVGCEAARNRGGIAIAQEGSTCTVNGMPASLIKAGLADRIVPLDKIAAEIKSLVN